MAVRRRVRENPRKGKETSVNYQRSPWKIAFICVILVIALSVSALIIVERNLGYLPSVKSLFSLTSGSSYKVTLPEDGTKKEISPGQSVNLDLIVMKKTGSSYQSAELPRKYLVRMFFSDATLCDRLDYTTIYLHEDVAVGTEFSVNVVYEKESSRLNFTVVAPGESGEPSGEETQVAE